MLLEAIADQLRRLNPEALVRPFLDKVAASDADVIVNEDLRDVEVDKPALEQEGFALVRIVAPPELRAARRQQRGDVSSSDKSASFVHGLSYRYTIENRRGIDEYESNVRTVLEQLLDS
ncbi:hypothetical protein OG948_56615 (plasmid) [Embleya sp. NBC_00888]|uniref:hypothetical protein n=1 Tax=Embleya sp. NBC_00888 TaxID=2975960 RepID=UPI002F9124DD|nr:hypothetical protein OG948_56615 [Embleya sp. NBC_00888]